MPDALLNLATMYLEFDTPETYLQLYEESKDVFEIKFDEYYQKFVLDLPDLEDRWFAYLNTPQEWLDNDRWLAHVDAKVKIEDKEYTLSFAHIVVERGYYDRGHEFDIGFFLEHFADWEEDIEQDDAPEVEAEYSYPKPVKVKLDMDILNQWKEELIRQRIGSFRNDW